MSKVIDYMFFACAIIAGAVMFAFGVRHIYRRADSPRFRRFLIHLSVVLVFLGGKLGAFRTISAEDSAKAVETQSEDKSTPRGPIGYPLDRRDEWVAVRALYDHVRELKAADLDKEKFSAEVAAAEKTLKGLDALVELKMITTEMRDYLKSEINEELQKANPETAGKEVPQTDVLKSFWEQIKENSATLDDQVQPHPWLLRLLLEDTAEQFTRVKAISLADRLKDLSIESKEYKATVAALMEGFWKKYKAARQLEGILIRLRRIRDLPPSPMPMYGIEPREMMSLDMEPVYIEKQSSKEPEYDFSAEFLALQAVIARSGGRIVVEAPDGVMIKKADEAEWKPLEKGETLALTDLIEYEKEGEAKIVLEDTRHTAIKGDCLLTTWEYDLQVPEALCNEIAALIIKLGDEDYNIREEATEKLKKLAHVALPQLEEALKSSDLEVRARAQAILDSLKGEDPDKTKEKPDSSGGDETPGVAPGSGGRAEPKANDMNRP